MTRRSLKPPQWIGRRSAFRLVIAFAAMFRPYRSMATNAGRTRVGAIRWDAWYGGVAGKDSSWFAAHDLDPARYHPRAPWFATRLRADAMSIVGGQSDMDDEITYAKDAGLKYWAFCKYDPSNSLSQAWKLFQASRKAGTMNWCWIYGYGRFHRDVQETLPTLVAQCAQPNYEKITPNRPMIYLLADPGATLAQVNADVKLFRAACASAAIGDPYVVTMNGSAEKAQAAYSATGADAISSYGFARPTNYGTYASLDLATRAFWADLSDTGLPLVPCAVTGWDRRPRIEHPVPWEEKTQQPGVGMANSFATALPSEVAAHVQALVAFIEAHPSACPAHNGLVYAWDEFDEGGWLCPTWTGSGPDDSRIRALRFVLEG